jgi:TonB family protein
MTAVPEKIRAGLVELRTPLGSVYVTPSFWQRVYLVWTFRNFRTLPKQVLNRRQQHLIDKLCRAPILSRNRPLGSSLIGAVENVLLPQPKVEPSPSMDNLVERKTSARRETLPPGVPASEQSSDAETRAFDVAHFLARGQEVRHAVARQLPRIEFRGALVHTRQMLRGTLAHARRWALLAAGAALLASASIYIHERLSGRSISVPKVEAHESLSSGQPSPVVHADPVTSSPASQAMPPPSVNADKSSSAIVPPKKEERNRELEHASLRQPLSVDEDPGIERVQVAEPPDTGFSYPVAPDPNLTGRVDLKAVIGSDGSIKGVDVLSGNRTLAAAAVEAVRHWRYRPPEVNGHAVEAETKIVISFVGDDAVSVRFPANP